MLFAGATLLLLIFLSERKRESCRLLSGYPADLPVVKAFFIVFFLPGWIFLLSGRGPCGWMTWICVMFDLKIKKQKNIWFHSPIFFGPSFSSFSVFYHRYP